MTATLQMIVPRLVNLLLGQPPDTSDRNGAVALVSAFAENASLPGVWTKVDKSRYCQRLAELVRAPHQLNQAGTSFCAPAAVLLTFAQSYPKRFAKFGIDLLASGNVQLGSRTINMTKGIRESDIPGWIETSNWGIQLADLLLILAIQEDMTWLNINDPSSWALAPPVMANAYGSDIKKTLGSSGLFQATEIPATADGLQEALGQPGSLVIGVGPMSMFSNVSSSRHAAVFAPPLSIDNSTVKYRFWSWGTFENHNTFPLVGGHWRESSMGKTQFDAKLDMALRIRVTGSDLD